MGGPAVLVPVKDFRAAKVRLADRLTPDRRAALAEEMATTVVKAARDLPVAVVCDTEPVRAWAESVGASVVWAPGRGLNGAVADGVAALRDEGHDRVIVAHADLPLADDLRWVADFDGITLVPDRKRDGTNVLAVPTACEFQFAYGPGSFARHLEHAQSLGLAIRLVNDKALAWDVDEPADLDLPSLPLPGRSGRGSPAEPRSGIGLRSSM